MKTNVVTIKQLGTECWSTVRIVQHDCTKCELLERCHNKDKGIYPNQKPKALFEAQLRFKKYRERLMKHLITDNENLKQQEREIRNGRKKVS